MRALCGAGRHLGTHVKATHVPRLMSPKLGSSRRDQLASARPPSVTHDNVLPRWQDVATARAAKIKYWRHRAVFTNLGLEISDDQIYHTCQGIINGEIVLLDGKIRRHFCFVSVGNHLGTHYVFLSSSIIKFDSLLYIIFRSEICHLYSYSYSSSMIALYSEQQKLRYNTKSNFLPHFTTHYILQNSYFLQAYNAKFIYKHGIRFT